MSYFVKIETARGDREVWGVDLEHAVKQSLTQPRVIRLLDPAWAGAGAVSLNRLIRTLEEMVGDQLIEDLAIPYTAVATDLVARREVWFQHGPLIPAIRASIAIP